VINANDVTAMTIDGAQLLDDLRSFMARFVVYPSKHHKSAHTLWIAHCWWMDHWESTPRIAFLSPEPGSGKSRALEVTEPLVPRPVHAVNTTSAYLFRKVSDPLGRPTVLYDECDTLFGPRAKEHEEVRGMINAGHRKGAVAGRCVVRGKVVETEELPAYAAVALAGLDDLPDTMMSRSVIVRMKRRAPTESIAPWRRRINGPEAAELYKRLMDWSNAVIPLEDGWPDMPASVEDRDADIWEALLAVADLAGGRWPQTARAAATALVAESKVAAPSLGILLLSDIRSIFDENTGGDLFGNTCDRISTSDLLKKLNDLEESPWAVIRKGEPLNARGLANRLGRYGIRPSQYRVDADDRIRGYHRSAFVDAWSRYLPGSASTESESSETSGTPAGSVPDDSDVSDPMEANPRCPCGNQLASEESRHRGYCTPCFFRRKQETGSA
jgi:hypothetical protein